MKLLTIQHADFERLGIIQTWIDEHQYESQCVKPYAGDRLPTEYDFDLLIILGGPQSPLELDKFPYLQNEIDFTKKALERNKRVWGTCLGAQIIGEALGAKTQRSPNKEIGVFNITLTKAASTDPVFKSFPHSFPVAHWHSDMPGIPEGAEILASSPGCPRQIIRFREGIYGFQCHLEMTKTDILRVADNCSQDYAEPGLYIMTRKEMAESVYGAMNAQMRQMLDHLAR